MMCAHENPFRSVCVEALAFRFAPGESVTSVLDRWTALGGCGVLIGPKGSGKTTLLETLAGALMARGQSVRWLRLRRESAETRARVAAFLAQDVAATVVCLDGLEQLGPWRWWRVRRHVRHAAGLIATSHAPGRLPILRQHATSPALLRDLIQELAGSEWPDTDHLWQDQKGDVRQCLAALYRAAALGIDSRMPVSSIAHHV